MIHVTRERIMELLSTVKDPEIPVLSLVDLGVIQGVLIDEGSVTIELTPTFVGCPALEVMKQEIRDVLKQHGLDEVSVVVSYKTPWTSDMISENGRIALKSFGLAPPPLRQVFSDLEMWEHAECPRCGGLNTEVRNTFGPTLCRSIHYCNDCKEAFEQFKTV